MDETNIRKIFGENVKFYRKKQGLSQEQLAELLEISTNHLSVIETGTKFVTYCFWKGSFKNLKYFHLHYFIVQKSQNMIIQI